VRQLENELEQSLKKLDIVGRAKGFSKGRSTSKTKVERTTFRNSGGRKPLYNGGSNYSSPAYRGNSNNRSKQYSPSNSNTASKYRKNSPSAVSNTSKKKTTPTRNNSNKGSPVGNRLYSPSGRPRDNSPTGGQRKPGAVQRINEAFSPKSKTKGPTKAEIYKRYNGLSKNSKNKRSQNGGSSNASPSNRPNSSSVYSNATKKRKPKANASNRSNSAKGKKPKMGSKNIKNEKEVKLQDTGPPSLQPSVSGPKPPSENEGGEISEIEAKINRLEEMLRMAKQ